MEPASAARGTRGATLGVCLALAAGVLAVYGPTLGHGWLNYDDDVYVHANPLVRGGLGADGLARVWTEVHSFTWHPLTTLSHMLDVQLWGLAPGGHHATSVLLHAATAVLLFLVLRGMTGSLGRSAAVAALFAFHPQRVESVAWISERKDVLSGLLFVATLGAWTRYARARLPGAPFPLRRYLLALALFALGLLAKPMLVTLPCVLLLLDVWPLGRLRARAAGLGALVLEKLPFLALSAACSLVALRTQEGAMTSAETLPLAARLANAAVAPLAYVRQFLLPVDLALVYPHPRGGLPGQEVALAALGLVAATAAVLAARRRAPYLAVGWLWFLGMLVPVSGLVQVGVQSHADRYTYLPTIGLALLLVWGVAAWLPAGGRKALAPAAALAAVVLAGLSYAQVGRWQTSESIWRHTLACTTDNGLAHAQLGVALADAGRVDEAVEQYERALAIQPDHATPLYNLANVRAAQGDLEGAITLYRRAVAARPDYGRAWNNLGAALVSRGRADEGLRAFGRALELDPRHVGARVNLAEALAAAGRVDEARAQYEAALEADPTAAAPRRGLGTLLLRTGRADEGLALLREAVRLDPDDADAHADLAMALATGGTLDEALEHFRRAADLDPESPQKRGNLAMAQERAGRRREAAASYGRAAELAAARGEAELAASLRARAAALGGE